MNETTVQAVGESLNALAGGQAVITTHQLRRKGACESNVERFREKFGASAVVTEENAIAAIGMDFGWAAEVLLPAYPEICGFSNESWYDTWRTLERKYHQTESEAFDAARRERENALDHFQTTAEYDRIWNLHEKKLDELRDARDKKRNEGEAIWFARLYRLAVGITTDDWYVKEKANASEATGSTDGNADTLSTAPTAVPSEAGGLVGGSGPEDAGSSDGAGNDRAADPSNPADSGDSLEGVSSGGNV